MSDTVSRDDVVVFVSTRKGAFILTHSSGKWSINGPHHLGQIIHHLVQDPRDRNNLLMAASTGHLGPTMFRSSDMGATWTEVPGPPAFPKVEDGTGRSVNHTFWLTPSNASEPGTWYGGTSPQALFRTEDGGDTWSEVSGFNDTAVEKGWIMGPGDGTPDGPKLHSILVDPRDASHLYVSMSSGGTFESTDRGETWAPLNKGVLALFNPDPDPEFGHDPHCVVQHPLNPDRLYQQNHCGIYRIDRPENRWTRIGESMPAEIGDIGFPIVMHPRDPDTVWVFPMDGTEVWPRVSIGGKPAAYRSTDAGATWERQDKGLPAEQGWFTVKRQSMASDGCDPVGLYFGTTSGEVWASMDEGASWTQIAAHLPHIYAVETGVKP